MFLLPSSAFPCRWLWFSQSFLAFHIGQVNKILCTATSGEGSASLPPVPRAGGPMHTIAKWLEGPSCMAIFLNPQLHLGLPDVTPARLCHPGLLFLVLESLSFPCSLFFFLKKIIYLFIGCAGSLLLRGLFSSCSEWELFSSCGVLLSHYDDFSCCGVWALECVGWEVVAHERA